MTNTSSDTTDEPIKPDPQPEPSPEPNPENKPVEPEHQPEVAPETEPTGQNNGHDSTNTVPDPSQDNTGKQEESKAPVEIPKTVAPLVENLLKKFNAFSLSTFLASTLITIIKVMLFASLQIEDKVLRSYTSGDFSCFEGV